MIRTHDETSAALLSAAHHLLATEGPDALTVRRIATEASMSTMNVYSRFGGKDGVIDELYTDGFRRLTAAIDSIPETDDVSADLLAMATTYRAFAIDNPRYYDIMFTRWSREHDTERIGLRGLANFVERLQRAVDVGGIHLPGGLDAESAAIYLWASCHGMVSLELNQKANDEIDWQHVYHRGTAALVTSLAGTRAADPA
jgi:AcrR family transcriptional regulator